MMLTNMRIVHGDQAALRREYFKVALAGLLAREQTEITRLEAIIELAWAYADEAMKQERHASRD